jgi:uncharacterized protein (TIGR02391 family)
MPFSQGDARDVITSALSPRMRMSIPISSLVPDVDDLLRLEVEELAGVLLVHLNSLTEIIPGIFFGSLSQQPEYAGKRRDETIWALREAWAWLESAGFLMTSPFAGAWFISRRGRQITSQADFAAYRKASLLPKAQVHALIAAKVYPAFLRGEYDTAVFQAFREVEIAVRTAGGFNLNMVGDKLMRAAFGNAQTPGPLADKTIPPAEQEAMAHLFAGAFGLYRNSTAHRYVPTNAEEAAEVVIIFASQLLRIVDRLTPQPIGVAKP